MYELYSLDPTLPQNVGGCVSMHSVVITLTSSSEGCNKNKGDPIVSGVPGIQVSNVPLGWDRGEICTGLKI